MSNATKIREGLKKAGYEVFGGVNAPYIWLKTSDNLSSWDFFDRLLDKAQVVGTPGSGFGPAGEGYFRLSAFGKKKTWKKRLHEFLLFEVQSRRSKFSNLYMIFKK